MKKSDQRNLNPTAPALLAMWRWSEEYAAQRGGVMDFWDVQPEHRQRLCIEAAERVAEVLRPTVR
jgi:hypothetical protein